MPGLRAAIVPVTPFQQNCTLLFDEDTRKGVVIDPGGDVDRIQAAIAELGLTVEGILLTHGHIDHAAGADELREALGVTITGRIATTSRCSTPCRRRPRCTASPARAT